MPFVKEASTADQLLRARVAEFESARGQLNQYTNRFDAAGSARLTNLNRSADALFNAWSSGRITEEEYLKATSGLYDTAEKFRWQNHTIPEEQIPGNISTKDGVRLMKTADGFEIVGYDPSYVEKNAVRLTDAGHMAVPLSPRQGFTVIEPAKTIKRDLQMEQDAIEKTQKQIADRYEKLQEMRQNGREVFDEAGQVIGYQPFTEDEQNQMAAEAGSLYVKQYMQAKHALRQVADNGLLGKENIAVQGDTFDPFVQTLEQRLAAPTPTQTPLPDLGSAAQPQAMATDLTQRTVPIYSQGRGIGEQIDQGWRATERTQMIPGQAPAQAPVEPAGGATTPQDLGIPFVPQQAGKIPTVRENAFPEQLLEAATMRQPAMAYSKDELITTFKDAPEGAVVELVDGRRYVKDSGKFWQVPWSAEQASSPYMLDAKGRPYLRRDAEGTVKVGPDKIPYKPVPGIAQQLESSRAKSAQRAAVAQQPQPTPRQQLPTTAAAAHVETHLQSAPPAAAMAAASAASPQDALQDLVSNWEAVPSLVEQVGAATRLRDRKEADAAAIGTVVIGPDGAMYYKLGQDSYLPMPKARKKQATQPVAQPSPQEDERLQSRMAQLMSVM